MRTLGGFEWNRRQAQWAIFRGRSCGCRRLLQPVDLFDQHEDDECDDDEIEHRLQEHPVIDRRSPRCLGRGERGLLWRWEKAV